METVEARVLFSRFVVDTVADAGPGSLRAAILASNANDTPTAPVDDQIVFNIQPAGVQTINLASPLPAITGNVTLDGTTQPGYEPNHTPMIRLNGQSAGAGADGLRIASAGPVAASNVLGFIVSGFSGNGIVISGSFNSVSECYVGTDAAGAAAGPGNGGNGVLITGSNNLLTDSVIAFNAGAGVAVAPAAVGNVLAPNAYFSNAGLPIDLGDDGPTPNDTADTDAGANRRQNAPVITSVAPAAAPAAGLAVTGTVNTTPNTLVEVVVYSSPTNDGEGQTVLDVLRPFTTNAAGDGSFSVNLPSAPAGSWITATATTYAFTAETAETNTSEFSAPVAAAAGPAVSAAYVRSSQWAPPDANAANVTFQEYLEAHGLGDDVYGFRVDNRPTTPILPWINLDQVVLHYAAPLTAGGLPQPGGMTVRGDRAGGDYAVQSVTQLDPQTLALQLDRPLGNLSTGGENGLRVTVNIPGAAGGGPYALQLDVLQGDVDASGSVLAGDFADVKKRFFRSTNSPSGATADAGYSPFHDVDGSGNILANDYSEVKKRFFDNFVMTSAPSTVSAPARGITADLFGTVAVV
jgi:hypothetical protein